MLNLMGKENPTYEDLILYFKENHKYLEKSRFKTDEFYYVASKYLNISKKAKISTYIFEIKDDGVSFHYKFRFDRNNDTLSIQKYVASTINNDLEPIKSFLVTKIYNRYIDLINTEISVPILNDYEPNNSPLNLEKSLNKVYRPPGIKLFKLTRFLFSPKIQKNVFEAIIADWQEEYFEALFKKENWKARWINVRYTYAFLAAMWMKSPIGNLIQFVIKIAKQ